MPVNTQNISNLITLLAAWGIAFLVALWVSLMVWTYRDIRSRARDPGVRILSVVVVGLLFLPGVVIYLILRPAHTVEEEYQHTLEEEALLQSIEEVPECPGCGRHIKENWLVCPSCQTRLKKTCHHCHKLMELAWNICPYCGSPAPGKRRENPTMADLTQPTPVEDEMAGQPELFDETMMEEE